MGIKGYFKGKFLQMKKHNKEIYNGESNKAKYPIKMTNIYANENYKAGDANGFYIFKLEVNGKDSLVDAFKLGENLVKNNIYYTMYEFMVEDMYYMYIYGTAKSFAKVIEKFIHSVYVQSQIITKTEINQFLLYPAIYRNVYGSISDFDTSLTNDDITHDADNIIPIHVSLNIDMVNIYQVFTNIKYDYLTNDYTVLFREDDLLKTYKEQDNILEEENEKFDPSIDELI